MTSLGEQTDRQMATWRWHLALGAARLEFYLSIPGGCPSPSETWCPVRGLLPTTTGPQERPRSLCVQRASCTESPPRTAWVPAGEGSRFLSPPAS